MNVLLSHSVVHYYLLTFDGSSFILTNITYDFIFVTFGCYLYLIVSLSHWTITISNMTVLLSHSVILFLYNRTFITFGGFFFFFFLLTSDGSIVTLGNTNITYSRVFVTFDSSLIFTYI